MNTNMAISRRSLALLWAIACTAIFAPSTEALMDPTPQQCWSSLMQINGCVAEITRAAATMHPSNEIGEVCCEAIGGLDDNCWRLMYPSNPGVPSLVKGICAIVKAPPHHPTARPHGIIVNATVLARDAPEEAASGPSN